MTGSTQRNVAILVFDEVEVLDFAGPYEVFNVASAAARPSPFFVYAVGITGRPVVGRGRFVVTPAYSIADCPQPDILVVPGGSGTRPLLKHDTLVSWIGEQAKRVEWLLSVCTGALLLAKAGLLAGAGATTHHGAFEEMAGISPSTTIARDERFVQSSGNIFTSGGISAGIDLSLHVVKMLAGPRVHDAVVEEMEYGWHRR
jgi:transcriptional regulator GlxA family with amidase domain